MDFYELLDQVVDLLRSRGRVSYRALKMQFHLTDEAVEALKDELIAAQQLAVDEQGTVLVWTGAPAASSPPAAAPAPAQEWEPVAYTPPHLSEKIRTARTALSTAIELYRTMEMQFWLPQAEATLAQVEEW